MGRMIYTPHGGDFRAHLEEKVSSGQREIYITKPQQVTLTTGTPVEVGKVWRGTDQADFGRNKAEMEGVVKEIRKQRSGTVHAIILVEKLVCLESISTPLPKTKQELMKAEKRAKQFEMPVRFAK